MVRETGSANMLNRYAQVERDGSYVRPPHAKLGYGSMLAVRALFVMTSASSLAKAVTIAVRCVPRLVRAARTSARGG